MTGERDGSEGPVTNGTHVAGGAGTVGDGNGGTATLTVPGAPPGAPGPGEVDEAPRAAAPRSGSRLALSNWRVRWRILALIVVPTLAAVILGGLRISSGASSALADKRTQQVALLNADVVRLAQNMEDERDLTAGFIAAGRPQGNATLHIELTNQQSATDESAQQVTGQASSIGDTYSPSIRQGLNAVLARISDLPQLRAASGTGKIPTEPMIQDYTNSIDTLLTFTSLSGAGTSDTELANDVIVLTALARAEDQASAQRGTLFAALWTGQFAPQGLSDLQDEQAQQAAAEADFTSAASLPQQQLFQNTVSGTPVDQAAFEESLAISTSKNNSASIGSTGPNAADTWYKNMTSTLGKMRSVENTLMTSINSRSNSLQTSATRSAVIISIITLVLLILVLLVTTFVARSMIRPLRRLREDALDIAGTRLPDMVRRLSETEGSDESVEIEPIAVSSTDEIGEVARAFDQVHREAVRLAADEALLRGNLNAMFVNLSRRSQSLIERQISLIDSLEQGEQDSDRLSSLFRLDHLATRMRRNSENLLVLAGHEASRRWSQPVPLVDVLRAAISEIEQYERVVLNVQPGITVVGQAVNDVVHLVAELVENATTFSPEDSQVYVSGQPLTTGGVLLDVTDGGVGISDQEMGHANWRLDNPPVVDVGVSRRMGLFVVGRLAARHGVRVRLRHASSGGLTALVWLPDTVAQQEGAPLGRLRRVRGRGLRPRPVAVGPAGRHPGRTAHAAGRSRLQSARRGRGGRRGRPDPAVLTPYHQPAAPRGQRPAASAHPDRRCGPGLQLSARTSGPAGPGAAAGVRRRRAIQRVRRVRHRRVRPRPGRSAGSAPHPGGTAEASAAPGRPRSSRRSPGMASAGPGTNGDDSGVQVPAPPENGHQQRLPIFDSLESDWFRRSGTTHAATQAPVPGDGGTAAGRPGPRLRTRAGVRPRPWPRRARVPPPLLGSRAGCHVRTSSPDRWASPPRRPTTAAQDPLVRQMKSVAGCPVSSGACAKHVQLHLRPRSHRTDEIPA